MLDSDKLVFQSWPGPLLSVSLQASSWTSLSLLPHVQVRMPVVSQKVVVEVRLNLVVYAK